MPLMLSLERWILSPDTPSRVLVSGTNKRTYVKNMTRVDDEVRTLLGSESVGAEKDKSGRSLDMIGWFIDLDAQLVTISEKNFNKTLHAFFRNLLPSTRSKSWLHWHLTTHRLAW